MKIDNVTRLSDGGSACRFDYSVTPEECARGGSIRGSFDLSEISGLSILLYGWVRGSIFDLNAIAPTEIDNQTYSLIANHSDSKETLDILVRIHDVFFPIAGVLHNPDSTGRHVVLNYLNHPKNWLGNL